MTITKDHKQGFAVAVVLLLIIYFLFLRKGKTSNYKEGGGCNCDGASCTSNTTNCLGSWTYNQEHGTWSCAHCAGGGAISAHGGSGAVAGKLSIPKKTGFLAWLLG